MLGVTDNTYRHCRATTQVMYRREVVEQLKSALNTRARGGHVHVNFFVSISIILFLQSWESMGDAFHFTINFFILGISLFVLYWFL